MIIRERNEEFIMIKQHDHAQLAQFLYQHLKKSFLPNHHENDSLDLAIQLHDCGWIPFDEAPSWNDVSNAPYAFTDFPTSPKTVLYKYGIDEVETKDAYAALLCSEHYTRFLEKGNEEMAQTFVAREKQRQDRLQNELKLDNGQWLTDYEVLQFFDNLSLFICLNEPGTPQDNIHYFFENGITLPRNFDIDEPLYPTWTSTSEMRLDRSLFQEDITFNLRQTPISKQGIADYGLLHAYTQSELEEIPLKIVQQ